MISFACPQCGNQLNVDDRYAGQQGKCNRCGGVVTAPMQSEPPADLPFDPASLNIDLDNYTVPPPVPVRQRGGGTDWPMIIGWALFVVGLLAFFAGIPLLPAVCWLGSVVLVGVDASQQDLSGGKIAKWVILTFLFWMAAFPCYLVLRNRDPEEGGTVGIVLGIVALAILGTCGGMFLSFKRFAKSPEYQQFMQEFQKGYEQAQQQGQSPNQFPGTQAPTEQQ